MRTKNVLTQDDVKKMMAACEAEALKHKWVVSIAIVDDAGFMLAMQRGEGAGRRRFNRLAMRGPNLIVQHRIVS